MFDNLTPGGCLFTMGLVVLTHDKEQAYLSLGFRKWGALAVPLDIVSGLGDEAGQQFRALSPCSM